MSYERTLGAEVEAATAMPYEATTIPSWGGGGAVDVPYNPFLRQTVGAPRVRPAPIKAMGTIFGAMQSPVTTAVGVGLVLAGALTLYKAVRPSPKRAR